MLSRQISKIAPVLVVIAVAGVVTHAARSPLDHQRRAEIPVDLADLRPVVAAVDASFQARWKADGIKPAPAAPDLQVLRRLSLALHGSTPSLEEIREFESDQEPGRLERWTAHLLRDQRFAFYFAERLARGFVGTEGGQFLVFRRDRFVEWISGQLQQDVPYDAMVRSLISSQGLWTGEPATNFITAAVNEQEVDENKLAGKTVRAFLGQRIDCAQCHDHPFDHWKQGQFEGLAAFYGQVRQSIVGIEDKTSEKGTPVEYSVQDRKTLEQRVVDVSVPFHPEWLPESGTRRERLAAWVTHPENRQFERAIVNRVWALMFGRAFHEPVDDLPAAPEGREDLLDLLGRDFRAHHCDVKRLVEVIAASAPFRLDSQASEPDVKTGDLDRAEAEWALFPLIRLRPEQVIGSVLQSGTLQTADQNSHILFRMIRLLQGTQFVKEYGDLGERELEDRGGTIPQRLLLMNGNLASEAFKSGPVTAAGRISGMASTPEACVDAAYLVCLSRRPSPEEQAHFVAQLNDSSLQQQDVVEDLFWSLFNSTEFSWNH